MFLLVRAPRLKDRRSRLSDGSLAFLHALGVLESPDANASEPVYTCYGCSHHFWTHPDAALGGDLNAAARATKAAIQDQVMAWLEEP